MRWSVTFLQWPLATVSTERRDPAASLSMDTGRSPQRRALGGDPAEPVRGQPDMNTLHLILPSPSLPLLNGPAHVRIAGSVVAMRAKQA